MTIRKKQIKQNLHNYNGKNNYNGKVLYIKKLTVFMYKWKKSRFKVGLY